MSCLEGELILLFYDSQSRDPTLSINRTKFYSATVLRACEQIVLRPLTLSRPLDNYITYLRKHLNG
jgi:hypothetical protein